MLTLVIYIALLSAFAIQLAKKLGITEWMQVHGSRIVAELFSCDFCMSWWMNVILSVILAIGFGSWWALVLPFFATMITRFLL